MGAMKFYVSLFVLMLSFVNGFECNDGIDNSDRDTLADYPDDRGCESPDDDNEIDGECDDLIDNDNDGLTDYPEDTGCGGYGDMVEGDPPIYDCNDGIDNDGDGFIDYPEDPGCGYLEDNEDTSCSDGINNDYDNLIDIEDPGCEDELDETEFNPDGPECDDYIDNDGDHGKDMDDPDCDSVYDDKEASDCDDGIDNDGDGLIDWPDDPGCFWYVDNSELNEEIECDDGISNDCDGLPDMMDPGCESPTDDVELGTVECDDCIDNDGDDNIDFDLDIECTDASDDDESVYEPGLIQQLMSCVVDSDCYCGMVCENEICVNVIAGEELPEPIPQLGKCYIPGDIDNNGYVDCADVNCLTAATPIPPEIPPECVNLQCQDLAPIGNPDGNVDSLDVAVALRLAVENGYDCDFPLNPPGPRACVERQCYDFINNDQDIYTDYPQDIGCKDIFDDDEKAECNDGVDNDLDGKIDYWECIYYDDHGRCMRHSRTDLGCNNINDHSEKNDNECDDGIDNDHDGWIDIDDQHCRRIDDSSEKAECEDGIDNDHDGIIDMLDEHCHGLSDDSEEPDCMDDRDNDHDGVSDLRDDGCEEPDDFSEKTQCGDRIDNDGDGNIDLADNGCKNEETLTEIPQCDNDIDDDYDGFNDYPDDPGCSGLLDVSEKGTSICDDGIDNDNDGITDFSIKEPRRIGTRGQIDWIFFSDPGCKEPISIKEDPACNDGVDNDNDGKIDTEDPACINAYWDNSELAANQCDNGFDDDSDGLLDYPDDTGCTSIEDSDETNYACNDGLDNDGDTYKDYPYDSGCGFIDDNSEYSTEYHCDNGLDDDNDGFEDYPADPGCEKPSDAKETNYDVECDDGWDNDQDGKEDYRASGGDSGCDSLLDADEHSLDYVCDNGLDDDKDGRVDYVYNYYTDPGCTAPTDNNEVGGGDDQCDDGIDNDYDGLIDYPSDQGCSSFSDDYEGTGMDCDNWVDDNGDDILDRLIDDDGDGKADYRPNDPVNDIGCMNVFDPSERVWSACDDTLDNDLDGFVDLNDAGCTGITDNSEAGDQGPVACNDKLDNDGDGLKDYGIFSTNDPGCSSANDLTETVDGAACDDGLDNDNDYLFDLDDPGCEDEYDVSERGEIYCDNGYDDDYDGYTDLNDLGCNDPSDDNELSDPGIGYECDDGIDNDGDGRLDYPDDPECIGPFSSEGAWQGPQCDNNRKDGDERDIDCGGDVCPLCEEGQTCSNDNDCRVGFCNEGICDDPCTQQGILSMNAPSYGPLIEPKATGCSCKSDLDCTTPPNTWCSKDGTCKQPSCTDTDKNGDETDIDCGGSCANKCKIGDKCTENSDCKSGINCLQIGPNLKRCGGCSEVYEGHNDPDANRVNIVFYGMEYGEIENPTIQFLKDINIGLDKDGDFWKQHKGLLELDVYKNNLNKFNFWWVPVIGDHPKHLYGLCIFQDCGKCISQCQNNLDKIYCTDLPNRQIINMCLWKCLGSTNMDTKESYNPSHLFNPETASTFAHEFQHQFIGLRDETPKVPEFQISGMNCASTLDEPQNPNDVSYLWGDLIGKVKNYPEGPLRVLHYQGCGGTMLWYRPTIVSLMKDSRDQRLGLVNERYVQQKLDQYTG